MKERRGRNVTIWWCGTAMLGIRCTRSMWCGSDYRGYLVVEKQRPTLIFSDSLKARKIDGRWCGMGGSLCRLGYLVQPGVTVVASPAERWLI